MMHSPTTTAKSISAVHPDIIKTHILTKIDGPTLASTACTSSFLHTLCTDEKLWTDISNSTFPSTNNSVISSVISSFPAGHRSFFANASSSIDYNKPILSDIESSTTATQLVSAVDIYYYDKPIYSKFEITETESSWFRSSPFRIELTDSKEPEPVTTITDSVKFENENDVKFESDISHGKHMKLSWIMIDPNRKRAVNLSSLTSVSANRHWLTGELQLEYATVMNCNIKCSMVVTCGGKEGGDLHVREVSLHVQDMEGKSLNGRDSLVIVEEAMESGRRKRGSGIEEKERYEKYVEMKIIIKEKKEKKERILDLIFMATGISIFLGFWGFFLL